MGLFEILSQCLEPLHHLFQRRYRVWIYSYHTFLDILRETCQQTFLSEYAFVRAFHPTVVAVDIC